jgi:mRNA interferase MazF
VGAFVKGDVVVVPFPFSQAAGEKKRPALVLASWPCLNTTDYLLCLISAQFVPDPHTMPLSPSDFESGSLDRMSYIRPSYLFTVAEGRIDRKIGALRADKLDEVTESIKGLL